VISRFSAKLVFIVGGRATGIPGGAVMDMGNSHLRTVANVDGAAILDTEAGQITTLNSTGAMVWQALDRGEEPDAIAATIARETGEQIEVVKKDVGDFIEALRKKNLSSY
jgi:hypothetical protein